MQHKSDRDRDRVSTDPILSRTSFFESRFSPFSLASSPQVISSPSQRFCKPLWFLFALYFRRGRFVCRGMWNGGCGGVKGRRNLRTVDGISHWRRRLDCSSSSLCPRGFPRAGVPESPVVVGGGWGVPRHSYHHSSRDTGRGPCRWGGAPWQSLGPILQIVDVDDDPVLGVVWGWGKKRIIGKKNWTTKISVFEKKKSVSCKKSMCKEIHTIYTQMNMNKMYDLLKKKSAVNLATGTR